MGNGVLCGVPGMTKRVVFEPTQGPRKGLPHILGTLEDETQPPEFLNGFHEGGRRIEFASLIKVTPRFVLYREVSPKPTGRFGQTMQTWDPR